MKNYLINRLKQLLALCVAVFSISSCQYKDIADAPFPEQTIYMPAAASGVYQINDTNATTGIFRYKLDIAARKLIVPLGVYRSGINNDGAITVDVSVDNDTINSLIAAGTLVDDRGRNIELLPSSAYTIASALSLRSGQENGVIGLDVDLDYIAGQPGKRFAVCIGVSSAQRAVSPGMGKTIVELNTNFIVPTPRFSLEVDRKNDKKIIFYNESSYATSFEWDFGDGETLVTRKDTIEHTYADYKTYGVKLTVTGITGKPVILDYPLHIWENMTAAYIKNPGNPFLRSDATRTQAIGNLADWTTTDNLKAASGGVLYGGYLKSKKVGDVVLENVMHLFSRNAIANGKIYQTITLPAGSYRLEFEPGSFMGSNDCYFAVVRGGVMPDADAIEGDNGVLAKLFFDSELTSAQELLFSTAETLDLTIGFVVNTKTPAAGTANEIIIKSVGLYK